MKRYDLAGKVEQFGAKQFWVCTLDKGIDLWVSYNTVVAIVDNLFERVYTGYAFRGYSRTTSKQCSQALYKYAFHYDVQSVYDETVEVEGIPKDVLYPDRFECEWDAIGKASIVSHRIAEYLS